MLSISCPSAPGNAPAVISADAYALIREAPDYTKYQLRLQRRLRSNVRVEPGENGCRLWLGVPHHNGYGNMRFDGRWDHVHRWAYQAFIGPIEEGKYVLHSCDVKICIRPEHLFLGTAQDNMTDKVSKGRQARGESHGGVKHPDRLVRYVQERYVPGCPTNGARPMARELGIPLGTIENWVSRRCRRQEKTLFDA
jgi:hypothetical protein